MEKVCAAIPVHFLFIALATALLALPGHDVIAGEHVTEPERILWYASPAGNWETEALPIGNGSMGCMIFGGAAEEHIQFNEDTLWLGDERDTGAYQAFGDLYIEMPHKEFKGYRRQLDIGRALHTIRYTSGGVVFTREYFASHPAHVMVFRFSANKPGACTGRIRLTDSHGAATRYEGGLIVVSGSLKGLTYKEKTFSLSLDYEARAVVLHTGGTLASDSSGISFIRCDALTIILSAGTDYINERGRGWKGEHPRGSVAARVSAAAGRPYGELRSEHIRDYRGLFGRLALDLGKTTGGIMKLPTNERLDSYRGAKIELSTNMKYEAPAVDLAGLPDPDLEELMFQYARYLMISSSRPGGMPANLQGLWNESNNPPWRSDYHTDVNIEMNYWFVDHANLSECFLPLAEWVNSIREVRKEETRAAFHTRGWLTHAENGIFGGSTWEWSKGDAAWVAQNLWDHYAFTRDRDYLRTRAYPVMKELCEFWADHLKELPGGTLVSPNGFSPEHGPREDGVSFDQQLVWDLFTNFIEASETLGGDESFRNSVISMKSRLRGPRIGSWGQLQEWMVDRDDPKDTHRHLSHLIALHPGRQISPLTTPQLADAAKVSLNARGDGGTGWSKAWKISMWARLHDGDRAHKLLSEMMRGNVYPNLFDTHPPFQIDGNFGYAAGICEMLVQSHMGQIHLLPALPDAWPDGSVTGMRARGGFGVDVWWRKGALHKAVIHSDKGGVCSLRAGVPVTVSCNGANIPPETVEPGLIAFPTAGGKEYVVTPAKGR